MNLLSHSWRYALSDSFVLRIAKETVAIFICKQCTGVMFSLAMIISQGPFKMIFDYLKKIFKFRYPLADLRKLFVLINDLYVSEQNRRNF